MPTISKKVYLASDMLLAFVDRNHTKHEQAAAFFRYFAQEKYQLFTDIISLYEAYQKIHDEMSSLIAKDFLRTMYISNISIYYPEESDMKAALKIFFQDKTGKLTLMKTIMAVIADRKNINQVCTFEYLHTIFGLNIFYIPI